MEFKGKGRRVGAGRMMGRFRIGKDKAGLPFPGKIF
jgi:hypothetical protein